MLGSDLKSRMAREVRQLAQTPPEGVKYVETDADALTEVHADLTGPEGTPYAGAVFRRPGPLNGVELGEEPADEDGQGNRRAGEAAAFPEMCACPEMRWECKAELPRGDR